MEVKDCNGKPLQDGDSGTITQNLKVKGAPDLKRGAKVKNIRLTDDPDYVDCKVEGVSMAVKTIYIKKN